MPLYGYDTMHAFELKQLHWPGVYHTMLIIAVNLI